MRTILNRSARIFCTLLLFILCSSIASAANTYKLRLSEIGAVNNSILADEDGEYSDWIEIYNPGDEQVNLFGWYLTDKADDLKKWVFPNISIGSGDYLIVYASGKDRSVVGANLHSNFKLSGSGEYLALVAPDTTQIADSFDPVYPAQSEDISYGLYQNQLVYFNNPTPGVANILGTQILVPEFSHERGFFNEAMDVALSVADDSFKIYYTIDGSRPNAATATLYQGPISITQTTPLSAVCINESGDLSLIITHTYLFPEDVVNQSNAPEGYPSKWSPFKFSSDLAPADYEMDPDVTQSEAYKNLMVPALKSLPSLCVVTDIDNIFSHDEDENTGGIYIYTGSTSKGSLGLGWERPVSIEYIDPKSNQNFQVNCGLLLHGGNSRVPENSQKHSFRVSFRSEYGAGELHYDLFDQKSAVKDFDHLVLRSGYNYSWMKNNATQRQNAQYIMDPFAKKTQLDMDQLAAHEKFVHLYLNGLYWGVYNISEKLNDDFMEAYMGGSTDDYDVVKDHNGVVDGTRTEFNAMMNLSSNGFESYNSYRYIVDNEILDVKNFIDYMMLNFYIGNKDWDGNNWIAAKSRVNPKKGYRYFSWDGETSLLDVNENLVSMNDGEPTKLYQALKKNSEFKLLFADRIQKHFFNKGALTVEETIKRYNKLADEIDTAIIAESARWGDYRKDVNPSDNERIVYTRNDHWLVKKMAMLEDYFPYRSEIVFEQLRNIGLYPSIDAPEFSNNGGDIAEPVDLEISASEGAIYFTIDGTDPREEGTSALTTSAMEYTEVLHVVGDGTIKARAKSGSVWSALARVEFDSDNKDTFIDDGTPVKAYASGNVFDVYNVNTTIYYTLPEEGALTIQIINIEGRVIKTLTEGWQVAGKNHITWSTDNAPKGIYLYRLIYNNTSVAGKMVVN